MGNQHLKPRNGHPTTINKIQYNQSVIFLLLRRYLYPPPEIHNLLVHAYAMESLQYFLIQNHYTFGIVTKTWYLLIIEIRV